MGVLGGIYIHSSCGQWNIDNV